MMKFKHWNWEEKGKIVKFHIGFIFKKICNIKEHENATQIKEPA